MNRYVHILVIFFLVITTNIVSYSQCGPLTTMYAGNNGQDGIMFDIVAITTVTITGFDIDFYGNNHNIEIYYKDGTHVGFEMTPGAWTLLGTANNVIGNPRNSPTPIPIVLSQDICVGDVGAFYLTSTGTSASVSYTNGTAVGNVFVADLNIRILEGTGKNYPFNTSYSPRIPNITCYYNCIINCCTPTSVTTSPIGHN